MTPWDRLDKREKTNPKTCETIKMKTLFSALLICTLAMATPAFAKTSKEVTTTGTIVTVTLKSITISVSQNNQTGQSTPAAQSTPAGQTNQETYKIEKHTVIKLDGNTSTVEKLSAGMSVSVIRSNDKAKSAKEIDATTAAPAAAKHS